jgi:O-antigen/teichoic acid export membrane protein
MATAHIEIAPPVPSDGDLAGPSAPWPSWSARHPAWPLNALLFGVPLWWALGLSEYAFVLFAIPMAVQLRRWHTRKGRRILAPPGFGLWLLFLLVTLAGVLTLSLTAPGTIPSPVSNRMISFGLRTASYLAATVVLLYAGNLTETELPRRRLAWLLGLVGIYATVGGLGGTLMPRFKFTSPLSYLIPGSVQQGNLLLQAMLHPGLAQVQTVLGAAEGRPDAPFVYTNEWGNCLALLLPWLMVGWWSFGTRRQRKIAVATIAVAIVPIIYSLNRGLWLGLAAGLCYLAVRFAIRGRLALLGALVVVVTVVGIAVAATPLQSLIAERLSHGKSNEVRASLSVSAVRDALSSPFIGYGDTRHQQGSVQSIAVGRSAKCQQCGEVTIGSNGQLWLMLISSGFLGAVLYLGFFLFGCWRFWRDDSPYGLAGGLALLLTFVFMVAYTAVGTPLTFAMLSYALLWRNDRWRSLLASRDPAGRSRAVSPPPAARLRPAVRVNVRRSWPRPRAGMQLTRAVSNAGSRTATRATPAQPSSQKVPAGLGAGRGGRRAGLAGVARGGALNLAGAAVSAITTIGVTVVITRHFSKPVAGAFFTAISLFLILEAVASLGANVGAVNFIARLRSLGQVKRIPVILRAAVIPVVVVSILATIALLLAAGPLGRLVVSGHLAKAGASGSMVADALRALALVLPFAALLDTFLGATRGFRDMRPTVLVDKLGRSAGQLLGVLVAMAVGSVTLLAPLWALPYVPAAVAAWLWLRRIRRRPAQAPEPGDGREPAAADRRMTDITPRGFWRFTAPRALASLAQITIQRIDIVLVAFLRGPAAAAIYTAATRFLVAGQFGNTALNQAAQPRFAELFAVGDRRRANTLYRITTAWLILLTWPLYVLAVIYGPAVLSVFGHSYRAGDLVMVILGCTMLLATGCGQVDMVLITSGRSSWSLANGLMALVINVSLDLLLIPAYGITGAAIGWAGAIAVTNLTPLAQLAITLRLHPFGRSTLIACGLVTACFAVVPLAVRSAAGHSALASVGAVAGACVLFAAGLWWFRGQLRLSVMPGMSWLANRASRRTASARGGWPHRRRHHSPEHAPDFRPVPAIQDEGGD